MTKPRNNMQLPEMLNYGPNGDPSLEMFFDDLVTPLKKLGLVILGATTLVTQSPGVNDLDKEHIAHILVFKIPDIIPVGFRPSVVRILYDVGSQLCTFKYEIQANILFVYSFIAHDE